MHSNFKLSSYLLSTPHRSIGLTMNFIKIPVLVGCLLILFTAKASAQTTPVSFVKVVNGSVQVTTTSGETVVVSAGQTIAVTPTGQLVTGNAASSMASQAGAFNGVNISTLGGAAGVTNAVSAASGAISAVGITAIAVTIGAVAAVAAGPDTTGTTGTTGTAP